MGAITFGVVDRRIFAVTLPPPLPLSPTQLFFTTSNAPGTLSCNLAVPLKGAILASRTSKEKERKKERQRSGLGSIP